MRERGAIDPRRLVRPLRYVILIAVLGFAWFAWSGFDVLRLPAGPPILFDLPPEVLVIVTPLDRPPTRGEAVVFARPEGTVGYGRVVAVAGDALTPDRERARVRVGSDAWFPIPPALLRQLPLRDGDVLILAENPDAVLQGAVVPIGAVAARIVTALPF